MGVCQDCLVEVDGRPNERACTLKVDRPMMVRREVSGRTLPAVGVVPSRPPITMEDIPIKRPEVLVIGAGPIGMAVIEFLKVAKAEITVMDMNETRLQFCKEKLGVDHTVVFKNDDTEAARLREVNGGELPVTVIDATGSHISMSNAFQYASFTGQVLYVGITTQELAFKHVSIHRPELTIKASRNAVPADFVRIISLIEEGIINTDPWLSHQASYEDFILEFPKWLKPETGVIKAVLHMN